MAVQSHLSLVECNVTKVAVRLTQTNPIVACTVHCIK
jgi:hypothetical protein